MRLRKPCIHDRYEEHKVFADLPSQDFDCPGGEFLPEDAIVVERVDGEWPAEAFDRIEGAVRDVVGLVSPGTNLGVVALDALASLAAEGELG